MDLTLDKGIFLFIVLACLSHVYCKECECGINCDHFNGHIIDKECYYIAKIHRDHGKQFMFTNADYEKKIIDHVIKNTPDPQHVKFGTADSYRLRYYDNTCSRTNNCTKTVYHSNCKCKMSAFKTFWMKVYNVYTSNKELIVGLAGVALILVFILIISVLKCCCL